MNEETGEVEYGNGKVCAGKRFYFMTHAYHHVIADVLEMLGPQRARVTNVEWIYGCSRGWTEFFRDGAKSDTTFEKFQPGEISWFDVFEWPHDLPSVSKKGKK